MADVTAVIEADATPLRKTLNSVEKDVDTLANSITARLQRIGGAIEGIKSMYSTAAAGIQKALSFTAAAAEVEKVTAGFESLTGSAAAAQSIITELGDYSITTAYDPNQVYAAADKLMQAGIADARVSDIVKYLAKISRGKEDVLADLSKEVAKGYTSVEGYKVDFVSPFAEKGINLKGALEKVLGKQGEDLKKEIEKGLDFSVVAKALQELAADSGPLSKATDAMNNTLSGKVQQIKNTWGANMENFGLGINASLGPVLDSLAEKLRDILPYAAELGAQAGVYIGQALEIVAEFSGVLMDAAQWFGGLSGEAKLFAVVTVASFVLIRTGALSSITAITWSWRGMCTAMATGFRAAMVAVKGALISTGIGALIVGLGMAIEGLGLLDGGGNDGGDDIAATLRRTEAKQADEAAQNKLQMYTDTLQKLKGFDDMDALKTKMEAEREDAVKKYNAAMEKGEYEMASAHARYANGLYDLAVKINKEGYDIAKAAEDRRLQEIREAEARKNLEEAVKLAAEHEKAYAQAQLEYKRKLEDRRFAGQSVDKQQDWLMQQAAALGVRGGGDPRAALTAEIDRRSSVVGAGMSKEALEENKRIVDLLRRYRDMWLSLEDRKKALIKQEAEHEAQMAIKRAELSGDQKRTQLLKDQLELAEKIQSLKDAGFSGAQAAKMAREELGLDRLTQKKEQEAALLGSQPLLREVMAQSNVSIGNGGVSLGMAKNTLQETKKQTVLLTEIRDIQRKWKPGEIVLSA